MTFMRKTAKVIIGIFLVFIFLSGALFILITFGNRSFDTTSITNAGFAIFAGCASVCFSWARNIDERIISHKIRLSGERFFFSSLCFVVASLLKYIYLHREQLISTKILIYVNFLFPLIHGLGGIIFMAAYITVWTSVIEVFRILFRKVFD